ncbi:prion-inhibition and propagation-domain-containing protein [Annulohypoxylon moriforme]|nr:prion-inhibition and propagation-domain-containing protein [Annulohypoxylon moriforme]
MLTPITSIFPKRSQNSTHYDHDDSTPSETMDNVSTAISLFQFAIETLGRIQLAREFEDDFEAYQLKLDIIQLRLSRWGEIVRISTIDDIGNNGSGEYDLNIVKAILGSIHDRLAKAFRDAQKLQRKISKDDAQLLDPDSYMPMDLKKIRNRFKEFLQRRKAQTFKVVEGIKWAFYKKESFDKFIVSISELIDELEKILPEADRERLRKLSDEECKGISKSNLEELKEILDGCDPWLECSVDDKLNASGFGTVINQSRNVGSTVGIHNGDNKGISYGPHSTQTNTFN